MLLPYTAKAMSNNLHFNKSKGFQRASPDHRPLLFCSTFICTFADVEVHPDYGATSEQIPSDFRPTSEPPRSHHGATTEPPPSHHPRADLVQITFSLTLKPISSWRMKKRKHPFGRKSFDSLKSLLPHSLASLAQGMSVSIHHFIHFYSYIYGKR